MAFAGMNFVAIVVAAVAGWLIGFFWNRLFAKSRTGALKPFVLALIANLIMAWMLAGVLGHLGPGQVTLRAGGRARSPRPGPGHVAQRPDLGGLFVVWF